MANANAPEAAEWLAREIERLRGLSYEDLAMLESQPEHRPVLTAAGTPLMLETQVFLGRPREDEPPSDGRRVGPCEAGLHREHRQG
jgi:hypothetical protein